MKHHNPYRNLMLVTAKTDLIQKKILRLTKQTTTFDNLGKEEEGELYS